MINIDRIKHVELGGGHTNKRKIIIDAAEIFGEIEVMALYEDGEELESKTVVTKQEALTAFYEMLQKYADPFQKAVYGKLEEGRKYTLVYLNDFGFPVTQKITFHSMDCRTYAQHSDVIEMFFTPYRKRNQYRQIFYNQSLMIFEGWQDMKESDTKETIKENDSMKVTKSKYACFDARYIDDLEHVFKNPIVVYKDYKTGVNGKIYA